MSKSVRELAAEHSDETWREHFTDFSDLMDVLADCIISNEYSIPDALNNAIALTEAGIDVKGRLIRKEQVPGKEAHLMCALTLGHADLFVDIKKSDLQRIASAIHQQLLDKELRFPFSFGRELYDAYADLFEEEKDVLALEDTFRLLDAVPAGVFQYGKYVIGPYGLVESSERRSVRFSRRVPAYHCSQPVCRIVHSVSLTTGYDAPINSHRSKLHRMLDDEKAPASEWWGLAQEVGGFTDSYYGDQNGATLVALIGDSLSDDEMRLLVSHLFDNTKGALRDQVRPFLEVRSSADAVEALGRSELLQIALLTTEDQLSVAIDRLVREKQIVVRKGDVRRPVTNEMMRSGAFHLAPELGHHGLRYASTNQGLAFLREARLLRQLYIRDNGSDIAELEWQLRGFDSADLDERLEDFIQTTTPRDAIRRLVLIRKTNMITACHEVHLEDGEELNDDDLVETILWKLGFDVHDDEDPHRYFWELHERISSLTQSARISGIGDSEVFRGVASLYFSQLEGLLLDALAFGTWVLLNDHTSAHFPFAYEDETDRQVGLTLLQVAHEDSDNDVEQFDFTSEKVELYALMRGFETLAKHLESIESRAGEFRRPERDYPEFAGKTNLKEFLFRSTVPYLDLTDASRSRLRTGLSEISAAMVSADVHQVRNDYSHYRRNSPEISQMGIALEAVGAAVREIETLGLARLLCWPTGVTSDAWGRNRYSFAGPRSMSHMFARPSNYDWMGMPNLGRPQYLVRAATLAEPNEVLRFTHRFDSEFSRMWMDYPKRRISGQDNLPGAEATAPASVAPEAK